MSSGDSVPRNIEPDPPPKPGLLSWLWATASAVCQRRKRSSVVPSVEDAEDGRRSSEHAVDLEESSSHPRLPSSSRQADLRALGEAEGGDLQVTRLPMSFPSSGAGATSPRDVGERLAVPTADQAAGHRSPSRAASSDSEEDSLENEEEESPPAVALLENPTVSRGVSSSELSEDSHDSIASSYESSGLSLTSPAVQSPSSEESSQISEETRSDTSSLAGSVPVSLSAAPASPSGDRKASKQEGLDSRPQCPICWTVLAGLTEASTVTLAPCGHVFCSHCAKRLPQKSKCPLCKAIIESKVGRIFYN